MTEWNPVGSASDVSNVNALNTNNFLTQLSGLMPQIQGSATDPLAAFSSALPGLFGQAIGLTNPLTQSIQNYASQIMPGTLSASLAPFMNENALYSSGAVDTATRAAGQVQAGAMRDIISGQMGLGGQLAGLGAGLLQGQQGLFGQLMGLQGQMSAPEWYYPTYVEGNTPLGDVLSVGAGLASMALPFIAPATTALGPLLAGLLGQAGAQATRAAFSPGVQGYQPSGGISYGGW